jgi:uncharacterized protein YbgA (DUF1722 family)/uncharacterized protein YbbK (DUF523 family)
VTRPRIGISRCLLGDEVRYDGGHKLDSFLVDTLGRHVAWVPVCPEVEVGMGTPREPIHLVTSSNGVVSGPHRVRLLGVASGHDWTDAMDRWRRERVAELTREDLSGYVLKKDSPSCGPDRVRVDAGGREVRDGRGLFAEALVAALPNLPVEDESRLRDAVARENFIERIFAYDRLKSFFTSPWTADTLVKFHTAHKLQLLSHSREAYDALGRLVAHSKDLGHREIETLYGRGFMGALRHAATRGTHADVMQHAVGHFTHNLEPASRQELASAIDEYRKGLVPIAMPLALIREYVRQNAVAYLLDQVYFEPYPSELCQPNHA